MPTEISSSAIEDWLATARPRLHRLAQLRGVAPEAIEDVVQETLLEAWKHQDRLHTPEGAHLWLDEICRNVCRRYTRKRLVEQQRLAFLAPSQDDERDATDTVLANIPDADAPDPLEALSRQELALLLDRALGALSSNARQVVELCYLLELPQREAAEQLGLSISALEARLHRARQQLRQMLNGPLRDDAEALGLALDQESAGGWRETRLWCTLCGRRRLMGMFLPQPDASANLHMRCPDCEQRYGLSDVDNSNVHSKGLVQLEGLQAFRPAWKRTMQGVTQQLRLALRAGGRTCPYCGAQASLQLIDKVQPAESGEEIVLRDWSVSPSLSVLALVEMLPLRIRRHQRRWRVRGQRSGVLVARANAAIYGRPSTLAQRTGTAGRIRGAARAALADGRRRQRRAPDRAGAPPDAGRAGGVLIHRSGKCLLPLRCLSAYQARVTPFCAITP